MKNDLMSCSDMIMKTFSNIESSTFKKNTKLAETWNKVVGKINGCGQNLIEHSEIVEIKNNILLIETDHPGWIQMLQMNKKFILNGFKMYAEELNIVSLAFRLKGSNATLKSVSYENELKKQSEISKKKLDEEQKIIEKFSNNTENENTEELPDELKAKFESLKNSMLTKNKNK